MTEYIFSNPERRRLTGWHLSVENSGEWQRGPSEISVISDQSKDDIKSAMAEAYSSAELVAVE